MQDWSDGETVAGGSSPPPTDPFSSAMIGRSFAGYEIRGQLGRGGMGVVYEAWDPRLHRPLALKMIRSEMLDEAGRRRFLLEAQACSRLNHPHVVTVYAAGEEGGNPYMAMELLHGRSLRRVLDEDDLDWRRKVELALDALGALARLHEAGIVHRDLKPENIMLTDEGVLKLMDFGLAHVEAAGLTQAGTVMGTPHYMSPEQVAGGAVDARSDVFSFGILLYEMLAGRRPFAGGSAMSVMYQIRNAEPPPLDDVPADLPPALRTCLGRALAKDPAGRQADAGELRAELAALVEGVEGAATRRRRRLVRLGGGGTLAVLGAVILALALRGPGEPAPDRDRAVQHNELGQDLDRRGQRVEARAEFRAATLADPGYPVPWNNLALLALQDGERAEADSLLRRALEIDPRYPDAWYNLGFLQEEMGRASEAEASYRRALEANPVFGAAWNNLGALLLTAGRLEEAREALERGLRDVAAADPARPYLERTLGRVAAAQGRREEAVALWRRALVGLPDDPTLRRLLAEAGEPVASEPGADTPR